jgi:Zn-dependent membrane protease YugP
MTQHTKIMITFAPEFPWGKFHNKLSTVLIIYCKMKKLVLFAVVAVAISLSACKKTAQTEAQEEVITVVEEVAAEEVVDSAAVVVEEAPAQ